MQLFEQIPRVDLQTGKRLVDSYVFKSYICDYCGNILDSEDYPIIASYKVNGILDKDLYNLGFYLENLPGVNLYSIFRDHPDFHYCQSFKHGKFCEQSLVKGWLDEREAAKNNGQVIVIEMLIIPMMFKRMAVIDQLLKDGYTPEQLKLEM